MQWIVGGLRIVLRCLLIWLWLVLYAGMPLDGPVQVVREIVVEVRSEARQAAEMRARVEANRERFFQPERHATLARDSNWPYDPQPPRPIAGTTGNIPAGLPGLDYMSPLPDNEPVTYYNDVNNKLLNDRSLKPWREPVTSYVNGITYPGMVPAPVRTSAGSTTYSRGFVEPAMPSAVSMTYGTWGSR